MSDMVQHVQPSAALSSPAREALAGWQTERNGLLSTLPQVDRELLGAHLFGTMLERGDVLQEPGKPIACVYFPYGGLVSLLSVLPEGRAIDTASIGREGAVGLQAGLGAKTAIGRAVVQFSAPAACIEAAGFAEVAARSKPVRDMIVHFSDSLLGQVQRLMACNTMHQAEGRLCRWLAHAHDRVGGDSLPFTQEFLADLLGLRRTTVTMIAHTLHTRGVINVRRGRIHIRDIAALEDKACACCHEVRSLSGLSASGSLA